VSHLRSIDHSYSDNGELTVIIYFTDGGRKRRRVYSHFDVAAVTLKDELVLSNNTLSVLLSIGNRHWPVASCLVLIKPISTTLCQ